MGRGFERGYRKAEEKIKVPHFAYKVPRVERRASAKQGCLYRALKLHKKSNIRFYSNLRMEKKPDRSEIIDPLVCFNAGAYGIKSDESAFIALVVGAGSALAWYISIPRLGLLALGDFSQRFLFL